MKTLINLLRIVLLLFKKRRWKELNLADFYISLVKFKKEKERWRRHVNFIRRVLPFLKK